MGRSEACRNSPRYGGIDPAKHRLMVAKIGLECRYFGLACRQRRARAGKLLPACGKVFRRGGNFSPERALASLAFAQGLARTRKILRAGGKRVRRVGEFSREGALAFLACRQGFARTRKLRCARSQLCPARSQRQIGTAHV